MSKGRYVFLTLIVVAVALAGVSAWLGTRVKSPAQVAAEAAEPVASPITAPVEQRLLRGTLALRGTVQSPPPIEVRAEPTIERGQVVVTGAPVRPGRTVREGTKLLEVSGRPVFVLRGSVPMYRDLRRGVQGRDVQQLQEALTRLGFRTGDRPGRFQAGTEAAMRRFYRARGYEPVTEPVEDQSGASAGSQEGASPPAGGQPEGGQGSGTGQPSGQPAQPPAATVERLVVPWSEVVFVRRLPTRVLTAPVGVGQRPEGPVLTLATGSPTVAVPLTQEERSVVKPGVKVVVDLEQGGAGVPATVSSVDEAQALPAGQDARSDARSGARSGGGDDRVGEGAGGDAGVPAGGWVARLVPTTRLDEGLIGRDVRVVVETASTKGKVLVVPLAAAWSRADGSTYVTVLAGDRRHDVAVEAGLAADGLVEVTPVGAASLRPGDLVVLGEQVQEPPP